MDAPALPPPAAPAETTVGEYLLMGLGILLGLLGSIMINIGNNVQALGMEMDAAQKLEAAQSTEGTEARRASGPR